MDLLGIAEKVAARYGPSEDVEAFVTHEKHFEVKAYDGEVESVASAEPRGAGVRVVRDGRVGFAYTTDVSDDALIETLERARDNAQHATPDEAVGLAEPAPAPAGPQLSGLFDDDHSSVTPEAKVAFALELERATRARDHRIKTVEDTLYADSDASIAIASSKGISGIYRRTDAWCYVYVIAEEEGDTEIGFEFDLARSLAALDPERVSVEAVTQAAQMLGARKLPSTRMPVVFDQGVAAQFVGVLGQALTGEAVQKGRSLFAGRVGDDVAASGLSLVDDGRLPSAPGSAPWDGEGVPTQRTDVIRDGVLNALLYDTKSARKAGVSSTGNATRAGFKSMPHPAPSNLAFEPTGEVRDEIFGRAERAFFVRQLHGVHSGANAVTGDFSVGASGLLVEAGDTLHGVKEVTIAAPMLEILSAIVAVGDDRRWLPFGGSYGGATTLIAEMTVAGE